MKLPATPSNKRRKRPLFQLHVTGALLMIPLTTEAFAPPSPCRVGVLPLRQALDMREQESARPRWRRAFRKVLQREPRTDSVFQVSQKDDAPIKASTMMQMNSHTDMNMIIAENNVGMDTILHNFDTLTPRDVFPNLTTNEVSAPYITTIDEMEMFMEDNVPELLIEDDDELSLGDLEAAVAQPIVKGDRATVINRLSKSWFERMLHGLVHRLSVQTPQGLTVCVDPKGAAKILRGKIRTDAEVTFKKIVTAPIQLSGGSVQAKRLVLNLWSFTPDLLRQGARRFPDQFDFHFNDCIFTEEDLIQSRSIRNGLQRLLARVLTRAGVSSNYVTVKSIRLLVSVSIQ